MKLIARGCAQTAREAGQSWDANSGRVLARYGAVRRVGSSCISAGKGQTCARYYTIQTDASVIDEMSIKRVSRAHCDELPPRIISSSLVVQFVRLTHLGAIEHVRPVQCVVLGNLMVHLGCEVVFGSNLLTGKCENTCIRC